MHISLFLPPPKKKKRKKKKKCKRHPIYSINVYKCTTVQTNKSITTNLEQGLSNTTTRLFVLVKLIILHLLTAHILHLFYNSYEAKKPSLRALQVNCIAFDGPTGLRQSTYIPKDKKRKRFFKHPFLQLCLIYFTSDVQN